MARMGLKVGAVAFGSYLAMGGGKPNWMNIGKMTGALTGNYDILNFVTGMGFDKFLVKSPKYPIGGMYFDGIMRTEHTSRIRATSYPVQTGANMTDHAFFEPAELTIEVMMTDAASENIINGLFGISDMTTSLVAQVAGSVLGGKVGKAINKGFKVFKQAQSIYSMFQNLTCTPDSITQTGDSRSINAWQALKAMQLDRIPINVSTRLQSYDNMIIEELTAPDDYTTANALKCTVRLREIIMADVATTATSARASASAKATASGQTPVTTGENVDKTAAAQIKDMGRRIL